MDQAQLDKIKQAMSYMDDSYFERIAARISILGEKAINLTTDIRGTFNKLALVQMGILNARYKGYERLTKNTAKSKFAKIIKENKTCIDGLTEQKSQLGSELSKLLADLSAVVEEIQTMREIPIDGKKQNEN